MSGNGPRESYTFDRVVRMVLSALVLIGLFLLVRYLSNVLIPFAAAVVLAYLLNPLVTLFEQKTGSRGAGVAITLVGLGVLGLALVAVGVPLVVSQAGRFGEQLQRLRQDIAETLPAPGGATAPPTSDSEEPAPDRPAAADEETEAGDGDTDKSALGLSELIDYWPTFRSEMASQANRSQAFSNLIDELHGTWVGATLVAVRNVAETGAFEDLVMQAGQRLVQGGWSALTFAINFFLGLTGLIIVVLYLVFLLLDFPEYARTWKSFLPPTYRGRIVEFLEEFDILMRRYFRGQAVVAGSVGVMFASAFSLIGLPMAVPFGLFVGLLNMVPYLQTVAIIPALLLAGLRALEGGSGLLSSVLLVLGIFAVIQVIQDALLVPKVMGKATGLRPVAILLGVFIWGKLLGFLGVLAAIPLTCLGIAYYRRYVLKHARRETEIRNE